MAFGYGSPSRLASGHTEPFMRRWKETGGRKGGEEGMLTFKYV